MAQALIPLKHGKNEMLSLVARLNGHVFDTDPVITYMLLEMPREQRLAYLPTYWTILVRSALLNGAVITEADNWKAASVILPPGKYIDNLWTLLSAGFLCVLWRMGFAGFWRLWTEFSGMTDRAKKIGLHGQKRYYYIFSIGTKHEHRGKGLAKAIMIDHQKTVESKNLPIWLEATSKGSRNLYLSLGFKEIEEILLGKYKVAADASLQPGGPGISIYAMVWWPESSSARP
ncbi:hypothetical protein N7495_008659 [Penicillium taxi]|uniref:uncharacterized protein n=1 Tax=Penicillium taxi TaxID=168475 RepID=UPI002545B990|nr:uncharacterized protein N7495_008659 [Penicillium taxi]KAJ5888618.1 hypothetical protein N7495_008659 [Penicillium taxi]